MNAVPTTQTDNDGMHTRALGLEFTLVENEIDGDSYQVSRGNATATAIIIPETYNLLPVKYIANDAFRNFRSLTSISIPSSIIHIGTYAFENCVGLTSLTIPSGVVTISGNAFLGCTGLTSVFIPNTVTSIQSSSFRRCSGLTSITFEDGNPNYRSEGNCVLQGTLLVFGIAGSVIPSSVTTIASNAFQYMTTLTDITIPSNVMSIGSSAFSGCTGLTSITIPSTVTSLGNSAFYGCSNLSSVTIQSDLTTIGEDMFAFCRSLSNFTIPSTVATIGSQAFRENLSLTSITIPSSVTTIASNAFNACQNIVFFTEIAESDAPAGWATGWNADRPVVWESGTGGLAFTLLGSGSAYEVSRGTASDAVISIPATYNSLPVTKIADNAFDQYSPLTSVTIPSSITSIGDYAFRGCVNLASVTIPNSVTSIGWVAFGGCESLTSLHIPASMTSLGNGAFAGCSGLTTMTADTGNTYLRAEGNCLIMRSNNGLMFGCQNTTIPNSVTRIINGAFESQSNLITLTIPSTVTQIGASAFVNCSSLTSINIPSGVQSIDMYTFSGCSSLTSITIPSSVTSISTQAFTNCSGLTSITIPASVNSIGFNAFSMCSGLTSLTVEAGNTTFRSEGNCLIQNSDNSLVLGIATSTIPSGVITIRSNAFNAVLGLRTLNIPSSVINIETLAFVGCSGLASVFIPTSVTTIAYGAFSECTSAVIFVAAETAPAGWANGWNSSRPVIYGVTTANVAPTALTSHSNGNTVYLSWTAPEGMYIPNFIRYDVYCDGSLLNVNTIITNPSFAHVNAPAGNHSYYVTAVYTTGESTASNTVQVTADSDKVSFAMTSLSGNYPNPFNPTTTISYDMAREGHVNIAVYNSKGQRVANLVDGVKGVGGHQVVWNGQDDSGKAVSSGIYFYRMTTSDFSSVKKMVMVK